MSTASSPRGLAPIAIFAYNRPDRVAALMDSLKASDGFAESPVTIFVDGPKRPGDLSAVEEVRSYVKSLDLPNVVCSFQDSNRGLRNSIFAGVTKLVDSYDRVIVLEDDLVVSPVAIQYFNESLLHYEHAQRVWSIAGYAYDVPLLRNSGATLALPFAQRGLERGSVSISTIGLHPKY